jgi:hypothetical protein
MVEMYSENGKIFVITNIILTACVDGYTADNHKLYVPV